MAFEVSNKDILNVIERVFKIRISFELANKIKDECLDLKKVNKMAFYGVVLEQQEIFAYDELHEQIEKNNNKISLIININSF
jgi:extradiol dioxygenase family protein